MGIAGGGLQPTMDEHSLMMMMMMMMMMTMELPSRIPIVITKEEVVSHYSINGTH